MKRLLSAILVFVMVLTLVPAMIAFEALAAEELSLAWNQGTYYDGTINPNLVSRKYAVIDCAEGDVITFTYPSADWAIYVYYKNDQGKYSYKTSKKGSNETFVVEAINGYVPTQLQLTAFHLSGNNVTITDELWETFDVTITKTSVQPTEKTFTFATQNVGLWNDGVNQGVSADKVEARAAAWQAKMTEYDIDILVGQEWLPYLDADKTVDANEKVFGGMYPYMYGTNTSTYDGKTVVSKTPLSDITYVAQVSNVGRRYLKAYTTINGKKVCIIDAHLSFEEDINTNRKEEIVELLNVAQSEKYVIIAGDFNVFTPDEFEIFEEAGYSLANCGAFGEFNTWPNLGRNPTADVNRILDNIIVSPGIKINSVVADDTKLSDHALLVAELELLEDEEITDNRLLCEHCNKFVTWTPITATNGGTGNAFLQSGHYYFPKDLTNISSQFYVGDTTYPSLDVIVDLRGHALKSAGRMFYMRKNSKLTIVDTVGCGTITGASAGTGGCIYVENSGAFTLYDGSVYATGNPTSDRKGGNVFLETNAKFAIYGGELYGGKSSHGGAIYAGNTNTVNIEGGLISGGTATTAGGAVYINAGTLTMNKGTITGGQGGSGGGIYLYSSVGNLNGGTIYGNSGTYGGNVHTAGNNSKGILNVGDINVYGGTATGAGGDYWVASDGKACLVTKTATITDHSGKNITTTAGDMVLRVNGTYIVHDHTIVTLTGTAPTCTETGISEGKYCTGCTTQTVNQETIPATGHSYEAVYTEPTFEEDGYTTYTCGGCGDNYVVADEGSKKIAATITTQPADVSVEAGENAQFTVVTLGADVTYCWEYSRNGSVWYKTFMDGYETATLTVPAILSRNGYQYRVTVTDNYGNQSVSQVVKLTVVQPDGVVKIQQQPVQQEAVAGSDAQFTVVATGDGLKYRWQYSKNGATWYDTTMEGYNTNQLTVTATKARNGYQYRCIITDSYGTQVTTDAAVLTVAAKTVITSGPADQTATDGKAVFCVNVEGNGLKYRWEYKRPDSSKWYDTAMEGYNTNQLTVTATKARNGYQYRCIITDNYGNETVSAEATLTVE